jgi:hypothetical protein
MRMSLAQLSTWTEQQKARLHRVAEGAVHAARESIVEGSPTTGSPGQPRLTGELDDSFVETIGPTSGRVVSHHPAVHVIEHGVRAGVPVQYIHGGGPHSVMLTKAGFGALVADVVQRERGDG